LSIDTEAKRKSIVSIGAPWMGPGLAVDGSIGLWDRLAIGYTYAGSILSLGGGYNVIGTIMVDDIVVRTTEAVDEFSRNVVVYDRLVRKVEI